ncbi:hypothetical protein [Mesorhizobium sp. L103C131B0]|uniref:hypothetical protein n=1 Tax=Mesorhizobium sp. L103C131B0 TaxID=1287089 RepID=UPI0003D04EEF|nr:hypothetical protein [Mesorhizobium sp. L103C131B0]ESZ56649.1 hypothetical protein X729_24295 [Mesorhizobium sp. L103C131B0]
MAEEFQSHFAELKLRMDRLAKRLGISSDQRTEAIWELIGKSLAQKEREFAGFPVFLDFRAPEIGRPLGLGDNEIAQKVQAHLAAHPNLRTVRQAVEAMRESGLLSNAITRESYQKAVSRGRRALAEEDTSKAAQAKADEQRLKEGRRKPRQF